MSGSGEIASEAYPKSGDEGEIRYKPFSLYHTPPFHAVLEVAQDLSFRT
jgi:hypothetical protein